MTNVHPITFQNMTSQYAFVLFFNEIPFHPPHHTKSLHLFSLAPTHPLPFLLRSPQRRREEENKREDSPETCPVSQPFLFFPPCSPHIGTHHHGACVCMCVPQLRYILRFSILCWAWGGGWLFAGMCVCRLCGRVTCLTCGGGA